MKEDKNFDQIDTNIPFEAEIDLAEITLLLWKRKYIVLMTFIVFFICSVVYALISTPVYESKTTFIINKTGKGRSSLLSNLGGLASFAGLDLSSQTGDGKFYLAVLKSRIFLSTLVDKYRLLPLLYKDKWNQETKTWILKGKEKPPSMNKACKYFKEQVMSVVEDKKTGLITLEIKWRDPKMASLLANSIIQMGNEYIRNMKIREYSTTIEYLKKQIDETSVVNMQKIFYKLIEQQIQNKSLAEVKKNFAFQVLDPAVPPDLPFKPRKKVIVLLGSLTGLFTGIFMVFIIKFFRETVFFVKNSG